MFAPLFEACSHVDRYTYYANHSICRRRRRFAGTAERPNSKISKTESGWDSFHQTLLKVLRALSSALRFTANAVAQFALPT